MNREFLSRLSETLPTLRAIASAGAGMALSLVAALFLVAALTPTSALAQDDAAGEVLACDRINDPSDRLACFGDLADRLRQGGARASRVVPPRPATLEAPSSASRSANSAVNPATSTDDDFGRDSIKNKTGQDKERAKKKRDERLSASIVRRWKTADGHFAVELDNGQIWRETDGSKVRIPKRSTSVEIYRGRFGGYRMKIEKAGQPAWVRRTK